MTWTVETITVATAETPGPEVFFQRAFGTWIDIAIHMFVLRDDTHTLLVDTGLIEDVEPLNAAMRRRKGPRAGFRPVPGAFARAMEAGPAAVLLTSLGPYAVGGLPNLPPSIPVYVSKRGLDNLRAAEEPELAHPIPAGIATRLAACADPIDGARPIAAGVDAIEIGIHHPASCAIRMETREGPLVIADPVFMRKNLTDGIALGAAEHAAGWHAAVRRLAAGGARFLPIHEPVPRPVLPGAWIRSRAGA